MPKLDNRLKAVARQIRARTHADIGSDHGHLLLALVKAGRIERGIAIENKRQPFDHSAAALVGLKAEVRFADGLEGLQENEADSLSICGVGGETIVRILEAYPQRIPPTIILQPNCGTEMVRRWGLKSEFRLVHEQITQGPRPFEVLRFERSHDAASDPAYDGLDRDAALRFGPLILSAREPNFIARLRDEREYLRNLAGLGDDMMKRLETIERVLEWE